MRTNPRKLVLASGSAYRQTLLARIFADFESKSPEIAESSRPGEQPDELSRRLATEKAHVIAEGCRQAIVIGSDQVAALNGQQLGKPGNHAAAAGQLAACSGQQVIFYTGVYVCCLESGFQELYLDKTSVNFRQLSGEEIDAYLQREKPWDCAGSFRSEGLGPVLFQSVSTDDPTALIGLPLIWLAGSLRRAGLSLL